ncbi:hypothetical protein BD413DRAFT_241150 [Trametes elegans]|nr:hypothetical protein BD413DRAFT_241150 [Trametes elegans]
MSYLHSFRIRQWRSGGASLNCVHPTQGKQKKLLPSVRPTFLSRLQRASFGKAFGAWFEVRSDRALLESRGTSMHPLCHSDTSPSGVAPGRLVDAARFLDSIRIHPPFRLGLESRNRRRNIKVPPISTAQAAIHEAVAGPPRRRDAPPATDVTTTMATVSAFAQRLPL